MEIYEHNSLHLNKENMQGKKSRANIFVSLVLSSAALLLSVFAVVFSCLGNETTEPYGCEYAFSAARPSCVEVYGAGYVGSGVVYRISGGKTYVLTNNHVINGAQNINVRFKEYGDGINGTVLGYDEYHDIAVIEIDGDFGASPVSIGASPKIGTQILAVGNNIGKGIAAFDGIVSRTSYHLKVNGEKTVPVYSVTSPVNAGMSGGGLFTLDGKIVGINTYQVNTTDNGSRPVQGMNYSVPFGIADKIAQVIIDKRPMAQIDKLSVQADVNSADEIDFVGLHFDATLCPEGLKVSMVRVSQATGEMQGGLPQVGDIVEKIGSLKINSSTCIADIYAECLKYEPDSNLNTAPITVVFKRELEKVTVSYDTKRLKYN